MFRRSCEAAAVMKPAIAGIFQLKEQIYDYVQCFEYFAFEEV